MVMENTRILLVEDHPDDVFLTLHALKKRSIRNVVVMNEAGEALRYLDALGDEERQNRQDVLPQLILVDLRLPKVDGFDFIREVRSKETTCDIPVVVLTSSDYIRDMEKCEELGVSAYITKPLDIDKFIEAASFLPQGKFSMGADNE